MIFVGIDNGVTGSIGIVGSGESAFYKTPVKKEQNYTKKKDNISRIDVIALAEILQLPNMFVVIERPMINPQRWKASMSAIRALESTITFLESISVGFQYIDSKEWQKEMLPKGVKGPTELKKASRDIGIRLFPGHKTLIEKLKDADGLLIAEYARRKYS